MRLSVVERPETPAKIGAKHWADVKKLTLAATENP